LVTAPVAHLVIPLAVTHCSPLSTRLLFRLIRLSQRLPALLSLSWQSGLLLASG
jgi:hypothetical protein